MHTFLSFTPSLFDFAAYEKGTAKTTSRKMEDIYN